MKTEKIKSIEIWRIYFAFMVLLMYTSLLPWFRDGHELLKSWHYMDFFFLLSGYLMAKHSEKPLTGGVGRDSCQFLLHKVKRIYPMYLLAIVLNIVARCAFTGFRLKWRTAKYYIWDLLLLRMSGLHGEVPRGTVIGFVIGPAWYLMAIVLAMAVLYPLMRKNKDVFLHILAPLVSIFLFGWFSQVYGQLSGPDTYMYGISIRLLRAIAGICLGCVIYLLCQRLRSLSFKRVRLIRVMATAVELLAVVLIFAASVRHRVGQTDFLCVLLEAVPLIIEFSGLGMINDIVKNWRLDWVRDFTLALNVSFYTWISLLVAWNPEWSREAGLLVFFSAAILTAIGFIWAMKGIRRLQARVKAHKRPA